MHTSTLAGSEMRSGLRAGLCVAVMMMCVHLFEPCDAKSEVLMGPTLGNIAREGKEQGLINVQNHQGLRASNPGEGTHGAKDHVSVAEELTTENTLTTRTTGMILSVMTRSGKCCGKRNRKHRKREKKYRKQEKKYRKMEKKRWKKYMKESKVSKTEAAQSTESKKTIEAGGDAPTQIILGLMGVLSI